MDLEQPQPIVVLRNGARSFRRRIRLALTRSSRHRAHWRSGVGCFERRVTGRVRPCPECSSPLQWLRSGRIATGEYDVYTACPNGCGTFRYDRTSQLFVRCG